MIPLGQTRKAVLRLSRAARQALGVAPDGRVRHESIQHEYWKHYSARRYAEKGYRVDLEAHRHGGKVDVLATRGNEQIAIEIEKANQT